MTLGAGGMCANGSMFVPMMARMAMQDAWRQAREPAKWAMRKEQAIAVENSAVCIEIDNIEKVKDRLEDHLADRGITLLGLPIDIDPNLPEDVIALRDKLGVTITRIFMLAVPCGWIVAKSK